MKYSLLFFLIGSQLMTAQGLPQSNILLIEWDKSWESDSQPKAFKMLTDFNNKGYNNQPHFIDNNRLLVTSDFEAHGLTDILELDLNGSQVKILTKTEESEYSPHYYNGVFSVVRQELDDSQPAPQILWSYPHSLQHGGQAIVNHIDHIGYFHPLSPDQYALFLVQDPSKLIIYHTETGRESFVSYNVSRSLHSYEGQLIFMSRLGSRWTFKKYDLDRRLSQTITNNPTDSQDFAIWDDHLIIADGSVLKAFSLKERNGWKTIIDLQSLGIEYVSRIACHGHKMAVVYH